MAINLDLYWSNVQKEGIVKKSNLRKNSILTVITIGSPQSFVNSSIYLQMFHHLASNLRLSLLAIDEVHLYRVVLYVLHLTDHSNMFYYNNKQNLPNVNTLIDTHICPIY